MKRVLLCAILLLFAFVSFGQRKYTYEYAVRDTGNLKMDLYVPEAQNEHHACLVFAYGGGFLSGSRNDTTQVAPIMRWAMDHGYVFIAFDYRLGLKGEKNLSVASGVKKFQQAIDIAAEDLLSCIDYTLRNLAQGTDYTIDPNYIITLGSSAGAITVLQADYMLCNGAEAAKMLPADFHFAGVMSFSGAIFSHKGKVKYTCHAPAPTLFCHGTIDRLVAYNQIKFFNIGLFGSNALVKRFEKFNYPYQIRRYEGIGHQIAGWYRKDFRLVEDFINDYVYDHRALQLDELLYDPDIKQIHWDHIRIRDMKKF